MYISNYTGFQTFIEPYTDTMYFKEGNETLCIIHVDNNWNMWGEVKDPFAIPIDILNPKFKPLNQKQCEELIMRHMPPRHRTDVKKRWGMEKIDYAILMYSTRLITLIDNYWMAWSEDDRAEDYHPKFNSNLMAERFNGAIVLDSEPEDFEEHPPLLSMDVMIQRCGCNTDAGEPFINKKYEKVRFE